MKILCLALVVLLALAGCTTKVTKVAPKAAPSPSSSTPAPSTPAPSPMPAPLAGSCHELTLKSASRPTDDASAVPCRKKHTSVTIKVGRINALADGHLLAVDSDQVQGQLSRVCPRSAPSYLGGDQRARRLSRFRVVWFGPSVHQADLGASWFRCDVVALDGNGLAELPTKLKGVLDDPDALTQFGTCATAAPDTKNLEPVVCSRKHSWVAADVIGLPRHAKYLGKPADAAANDSCKSISQSRNSGSLQFSWSFQWPTSDQWKSGRRYGFCWVPTT